MGGTARTVGAIPPPELKISSGADLLLSSPPQPRPAPARPPHSPAPHPSPSLPAGRGWGSAPQRPASSSWEGGWHWGTVPAGQVRLAPRDTRVRREVARGGGQGWPGEATWVIRCGEPRGQRRTKPAPLAPHRPPCHSRPPPPPAPRSPTRHTPTHHELHYNKPITPITGHVAGVAGVGHVSKVTRGGPRPKVATAAGR